MEHEQYVLKDKMPVCAILEPDMGQGPSPCHPRIIVVTHWRPQDDLACFGAGGDKSTMLAYVILEQLPHQKNLPIGGINSFVFRSLLDELLCWCFWPFVSEDLFIMNQCGEPNTTHV